MELGAIYSKEKTVFSVFSPIAEEISVILYDNGLDGKVIKKVPMSKRTNARKRSWIYFCICRRWNERHL